MKSIDVQYGVTFGKGDASDWIEWTVNVSDEERAIYDSDMLLKIDPNSDVRLSDCLARAYKEIEEEEISNGIDDEDEFVLECIGRVPMDQDRLNDLVAERDPYTLDYFRISDLSDEELEEWDAYELDEIPDVCDFEEGFEPESPYDVGWSLNVVFSEPDMSEAGEEEETLRILFDEKDYKTIHEYIERISNYTSKRSKTGLEKKARKVAKERGVLKEYEAAANGVVKRLRCGAER